MLTFDLSQPALDHIYIFNDEPFVRLIRGCKGAKVLQKKHVQPIRQLHTLMDERVTRKQASDGVQARREL